MRFWQVIGMDKSPKLEKKSQFWRVIGTDKLVKQWEGRLESWLNNNVLTAWENLMRISFCLKP